MSNLNDFHIENGVLTKYVGEGGDVVIPEGVTAIGKRAFYDCKSLISITIPDSVTSIGEGAFNFCTSLTDITIPYSVTSIEDFAFRSCKSLTSVTIPDRVTEIGVRAFSGCTNLTNITVPNSVTAIGFFAFEDCTSLISVTIPDGVTSIEYGIFYGCTSLANITIPNSVTSIGGSVFNKCEKLAIYINGAPEYGKECFLNVLKIISPNMPVSAFSSASEKRAAAKGFLTNQSLYTNSAVAEEYIKYAMCQKKKLLPEIFKDDDVSAISFYAENGKITVKNFQEEYLGIAEKAQAKNCIAYLLDWKNKNISYEDIEKETEREFNKDPFNAADMKKIWAHKVLEDDTLELINYKGDSTEIYIPERIGKKKVTRLADGLFAPEKAMNDVYRQNIFQSITSVIIPNSVTSIGNGAFSGCKGLQDNMGFVIVRDVLYSYHGSDTEITIPDGVTLIDGWAFGGCTNLTNITLPDSVTSFGCGAFEDCENLTSFTIPEGVTSIEGNTFRGCTNLTNVTIPDSVTAIGDEAFSYCSSLKSITIPDGVISIEECTFSDCTNLTNITIPNSVTSIGFWAFSGCDNLTIHAPAGSFAEQYAKENHILFVAEE